MIDELSPPTAPDAASSRVAERARREQIRADVNKMYQYIYGNWSTMIAYVYAELDIARLISESPKTVEDLARLTGSVPSSLTRFLRCAGALGFHKTDPSTGVLSLTDLGSLLWEDSAVCLRAVARLNGAPYRYQPWGHLLEYVKSGSGEKLSPTWESGTIEYLEDKPELLQVFRQAMIDLGNVAYQNVNEDRLIAASVDLSKHSSVIDIGCGNATLLDAILQANRSLQGTAFDLAEVLETVELPAANHPNTGRMSKICGDYQKSIPSGYDVYMMKNVIHNRPEQVCRMLLRNIRAAMVEGGADGRTPRHRRLLMFEFVGREEGEQDLISKLVDLNMNLLVGGTAGRTRGDYKRLLNDSGLELLSVSEITGLERKVIEGAVLF